MRRLVFALAAVAVVQAASPTAWEMTSYQDFLKSRFKNLSLTRDGRVTVAPRLTTVLSADEPVLWTAVSAANGDIFVATGHRGRLYRVPVSGQPQVMFTAPEPEIFALAMAADGSLFAATSPNGKVYRIRGGQASVYFDPKARYIWSLALGKDGALYAGTGDEGKVFRITAANTGEVYFESGQSHITALAQDAQGRLLAGSEPNGLLYRITAKEQAFVLYDANYPEIRVILPAPDGSIYAAALGGAVTKQTQPAAGATPSVTSNIQVTAPATTITVTDEDVNAQNPPGLDVKPKQPAQPQPAQQAPAAPVPAVEYAGVDKSAILRIFPDNTVETLWTSKEESAYDLAFLGDALVFGTDAHGRVYRLDTDRKTTLLAETGESQILRLAPTSNGLLLSTGDLGKLFRLDRAKAAAGEIESPVHDATTTSRWGRISWIGAGNLAFRTRTGNSARPDKTWSPWSPALTAAQGAAVASPNARYVQWKAEFTGEATLESVRLAYLPQNTAPAIKSVTVSAQTASAGSKPTAASAAALPTYSITVTDTGEAGPSSVSGTAAQPVSRASQEQLVISWASEDLDNDKLIYNLHFRGEGETEWKPLRLNFGETLHTLDAEALADGRYFFRVTVSDRQSNPEPYARTGELVSAPILIDRTPPQLKLTSRSAPAVRFAAEDSASPLKSCDYTLDAAAWTPLAPNDGVLDSQSEEFSVKVSAPAGEHLLVIRCYDSAGNAGLAKVVLR